MKHLAWMGGVAVVMASITVPAHALPSVAVSGAAGTLGVGAQATFELVPWVNVRAAAQGFGISHNLSKDNTDYEGKLHLLSYGAFVDVYPFTRGPRLSVGMFGNNNKIDINANCSTGCTANDITVSGNATFDGAIKFTKAAPYAGLGWGNAMAGLPFFFSTDIGVLVQGSPKVSLNASGTANVTDTTGQNGGNRTNVDVATDPNVQSQLSAEQSNLSSQLHSFRYYPVVALSLGWRF